MRAPRKTKNGRFSLGNRRWVAVLDNIHVLLHCHCILVLSPMNFVHLCKSELRYPGLRFIKNCDLYINITVLIPQKPCLFALRSPVSEFWRDCTILLHWPFPYFVRKNSCCINLNLSNCVVSSSLVICSETVSEVPLCWRFMAGHGCAIFRVDPSAEIFCSIRLLCPKHSSFLVPLLVKPLHIFHFISWDEQRWNVVI